MLSRWSLHKHLRRLVRFQPRGARFSRLANVMPMLSVLPEYPTAEGARFSRLANVMPGLPYWGFKLLVVTGCAIRLKSYADSKIPSSTAHKRHLLGDGVDHPLSPVGRRQVDRPLRWATTEGVVPNLYIPLALPPLALPPLGTTPPP